MAVCQTKEFETNGQLFQYEFRQYDNNDALIIGSSLVKEFENSSCDVLCIPGCRADDVPAVLPAINLQRYTKIALMFGANGLICRVRNSVIRRAQSVQTIIQHILNVIHSIHELNFTAKIYFLGLPPRMLPCYTDISAVNNGLQQMSTLHKNFEFIGTASKLANAGVIAQDNIHLNARGLRYLNDIVNKRIIHRTLWSNSIHSFLVSTNNWTTVVFYFHFAILKLLKALANCIANSLTLFCWSTEVLQKHA